MTSSHPAARSLQHWSTPITQVLRGPAREKVGIARSMRHAPPLANPGFSAVRDAARIAVGQAITA
jgi:hypothetical protein